MPKAIENGDLEWVFPLKMVIFPLKMVIFAAAGSNPGPHRSIFSVRHLLGHSCKHQLAIGNVLLVAVDGVLIQVETWSLWNLIMNQYPLSPYNIT
jgi:hypothetical protein